VLAVDGTKVSANASERATRDYEQIAREILEQAAEIDAREDEQFGDARGDELPPALSTREGRRRWLRDAQRRLDQRRAQEARPIPRSRTKRLLEARRRLHEELDVEQRANADYEAYRARGVMKDGRRFGGPPKPYQPPEQPQGKINLTDLDSRNVKTLRGWVQGYNAQAVCTEDQIVIAAEVTPSSADFGQLEPMVRAAERELAAAHVTDAPQVVLADAGYWHTEQIERLNARGLAVLVPPDAKKRKGERPGWQGRALHVDAHLARDRDRRRPLRAPQCDDRARLRAHEVQPRHRPFPATRESCRPLGMATDHRDPQPPEAPQLPAQGHLRLSRQVTEWA
jgi:hypothetical protein